MRFEVLGVEVDIAGIAAARKSSGLHLKMEAGEE
jgi:hypothetical protein